MNQREQQIQLQKLQQEKQQRAGEMFEQILKTELFPVEKLSSNWEKAVVRAVMKSKPLAQRISLEQFGQVVAAAHAGRKAFSLFEFGVLSNALETVSPEELGLNAAKYCDLVEEATFHIRWYGERVEQIRKEVATKIEEEVKTQIATNGLMRAVKE